MKIKKIEIKNFQQFKDFTLDLTYPKGHSKEGKPLDKVCFIGQSGTGKTTLLELLIRGYFPANLLLKNNIERHNFSKNGYCTTDLTNDIEPFKITNYGKGNQTLGGNNLDTFDNSPQELLFFPFKDLNFKDFEEDLKKEEEVYLTDKISKKRYYKFDYEGIIKIWRNIFEDIAIYKNEEANFRIQLTKRGEIENIDLKKEIKKWKENNPNPLQPIAEKCLDKVLNQFQLKTKTDIDSVEEINSIQIQSLVNDAVIPYERLSTGAKDFIFTALPLYLFEPKNGVILIDQPESSLYPNVQRQVTDIYTSFGENCQFFFATHSPIIASSFEPWEIVELDFDKEGYVYHKKYYKGENHVDNYHTDPQLLRWDSIFMKMFGVDTEGHDEREKALTKIARLKRQLEKLEQQNGNAIKQQKQKQEEYIELAQKLDWNL